MSTELKHDGLSAWRLHVTVAALTHVVGEIAALLPDEVEAQAVGAQISIWSARGTGSLRVVEMKELQVPGDAVSAADVPAEAALQALDALQEMVMDHLHQSWPESAGVSGGLHPQARRSGDQVEVGYVDASGGGHLLAPFPVPPEPERVVVAG